MDMMTRPEIEAFITEKIDSGFVWQDVVCMIADRWQDDIRENRDHAYQNGKDSVHEQGLVQL
jgi:hypothetical protein